MCLKKVHTNPRDGNENVLLNWAAVAGVDVTAEVVTVAAGFTVPAPVAGKKTAADAKAVPYHFPYRCPTMAFLCHGLSLVELLHILFD